MYPCERFLRWSVSRLCASALCPLTTLLHHDREGGSSLSGFRGVWCPEAQFPMCDGLTGFHQTTTLLGHMDTEHMYTLCADDPENICE
jgi:hypothetical protein